MSQLATTKMSSKGQVVILKRIPAPSLKEFDGLVKQARQQAKSSGFKKSDIKQVIQKARDQCYIDTSKIKTVR